MDSQTQNISDIETIYVTRKGLTESDVKGDENSHGNPNLKRFKTTFFFFYSQINPSLILDK